MLKFEKNLMKTPFLLESIILVGFVELLSDYDLVFVMVAEILVIRLTSSKCSLTLLTCNTGPLVVTVI